MYTKSAAQVQYWCCNLHTSINDTSARISATVQTLCVYINVADITLTIKCNSISLDINVHSTVHVSQQQMPSTPYTMLICIYAYYRESPYLRTMQAAINQCMLQLYSVAINALTTLVTLLEGHTQHHQFSSLSILYT